MAQKIKNPCIQVCKYDDDQVCIGCYRTMEETRDWIDYSEKEKAEVLKKVEKRRTPVVLQAGHLDFYV
ncbi:MAG: DUF1289 domain-containing protein [Chlorobi bacterium]|nr:DUF1289 domain-containing protein [Chlorobiota bacterium]